jgi:hypothetical protein
MSIKTYFEQVPLTKVKALIAEKQLANDSKVKTSKREEDTQKKPPREKSSGGGRIV